MGRVDFMRSVIVLYQQLSALARTRTWTNVLSLLYSVKCSKNVLYIYGYFFRERKTPFLFRGPDIKWKPTVGILDIGCIFFPLKTYVGPNVIWFLSTEKNTDKSFKHFTYIHSNDEFFSVSSIFPLLSSSRVILFDNEALHISTIYYLRVINRWSPTSVSSGWRVNDTDYWVTTYAART